MSNERKKSGLHHKGVKRRRELIASVIDWGSGGLNKAQAQAIARAFNEEINHPPMSQDRFDEAFLEAWAKVKESRLSRSSDTQSSELEYELFGSLEDVIATKPKFLWYPWIVKGAINFVEGMPEKGKSFLTMKIAAELSKGGKLPGEPDLEPGRVRSVRSRRIFRRSKARLPGCSRGWWRERTRWLFAVFRNHQEWVHTRQRRACLLGWRNRMGNA
jgi:hypothetical protein